MKNRLHEIFVVAPPGLEECCAGELSGLGIGGHVEPGGVGFEGGLRELYQANLHLRCASRVLVTLAEFGARDFPGLYKHAVQLPWGSFLRPGTPVRLRVTSRGSRLNHTGRIAETVEAALRHALGEGGGAAGAGEQLLLVTVQDDRCRISVDSSGELLHRRGYRRLVTPAPLRENLAAGMLRLLNWRPGEPLCDPFCGSGTLPIEAALLALGRPPGGNREFRFMQWPGYRSGLWQQLLTEARRSTIDPGAVRIIAADHDPDALAAARGNAASAGVEELIEFRLTDVAALDLDQAGGLLVANPPYGLRLEVSAQGPSPIQVVAQRLQADWRHWRCGLLTPDRPPGVGWRSAALLHNGGIAVQLWERRAHGEKASSSPM